MSDPFLAEIRMWPFSLTPKGWAACNGQYLYIHQYTRLYSLLGDSFGSGGPTRFRLPLFDAKAPMHWGGRAWSDSQALRQLLWQFHGRPNGETDALT